MRRTSNLVRDGQTRNGKVDAEDGLHDGLSFSYRPCLPEEVETIESQAAKEGNPRAAVRLIAAFVADRLGTWSEADGDPTFENVRRLPFDLFNKVYRVVVGMRASDPVDQPTKEEEDELVAALRSQVDGTPPGETMAETTEGN